MSELTRLIEAVRKWGIDHTGCEPSISCFHQAVDNLRMALENPPSVPVQDDHAPNTNYCALKTITDDQVKKVVRAFWRRIYCYRNDYGIELPSPLPIEFMAHMATALKWIDDAPHTTENSAWNLVTHENWNIPRIGQRVILCIDGVVQHDSFTLDQADGELGGGYYFWDRDDMNDDECPEVKAGDMWMAWPELEKKFVDLRQIVSDGSKA
jgi:hypothetical protein